MTQDQAKQLLILAAQADHLARMLELKRITEEQYIARLNDLRRQCGLYPLTLKRREREPVGAPVSYNCA